MHLLIAFIIGLLARPNNSSKRNPNSATSGEEHNQTQPTPVIVNYSPPPLSNEEIAKNTAAERRTILKYRFEIAGFFVLAIYTFFTALMYCTNRQAAIAARNAADVARDTLIASNRSWVGQSGPITLDFSTDRANEPSVKINLTLKNFGHSPATSVFAMANIVPNEELAQAAELTCKQTLNIRVAKSKHPLTGQTIFPEQEWRVAIEDSPIKSNDVILYAVGCITYRDDITDGIWWTQFCQETPNTASLYKTGQPLSTCNVYNETGKYEKLGVSPAF